MSSAAQAFRLALQAGNDFARGMDQPDFPSEEFLRLQEWQRQRFRLTYADFVARETDRPACQFFLEELYGGLGFRQRDEDVNRVEPIMSRLLPDRALLALSEALSLQLISLELDRSMAEVLRRKSVQFIDESCYVSIYRMVGRRHDRELQIDWVRKLGHELQALTQLPFLRGLVKAVRAPAQMAGYGRLQNFLEKGLSAFRKLEDPQRFVETIYQREMGLMKLWLAEEPGNIQSSFSC